MLELEQQFIITPALTPAVISVKSEWVDVRVGAPVLHYLNPYFWRDLSGKT